MRSIGCGRPDERLHASEKDFLVGIRKSKRGIRRMAATPRERLDVIGQQRYDHQAVIMAKFKVDADAAKKQIAVDIAPVKSLPKPNIKLA